MVKIVLNLWLSWFWGILESSGRGGKMRLAAPFDDKEGVYECRKSEKSEKYCSVIVVSSTWRVANPLSLFLAQMVKIFSNLWLSWFSCIFESSSRGGKMRLAAPLDDKEVGCESTESGTRNASKQRCFRVCTGWKIPAKHPHSRLSLLNVTPKDCTCAAARQYLKRPKAD